MTKKRKKQPRREVQCPYCDGPAELVRSRDIYPFARKDYGRFWQCEPCDAYVGTHKNSRDHAPYGMLANKELRALRNEAHEVFDPIWQYREQQGTDRSKARQDAYTWLAEQMGLQPHECHIGMFGPEKCIQTIVICKPKAQALAKPPARTASFKLL